MKVDTTSIKHDIVLLRQQYPIKEDVSLHQEIQRKLDSWESTLNNHLLSEFPYSEAEVELKQAQHCLKTPCFDLGKIKHDLKCFSNLANLVQVKIDKSFWHKEVQTIETKLSRANSKKDPKRIVNEQERKTLRTLLQKQWAKLFDQAESEWQLKEIEAARHEFLEKLEYWLKLLHELDEELSEILNTGVFLDLSLAELTQSDINQLLKWLQYIKDQSGVKELCNILGRMRVASTNTKQEKIKYTQYITEKVPDVNSKEEIIGVRLGKDIEHALPQELALMADPELSILFDLKYIEGRLMCFDMQGLTSIQKIETKEKTVNISKKEKMGPMIICVDTSGSMQGTPEVIAKAITLFMASKAKEQNRDCLLINFSTGIEVMSLSSNLGMKHVIEFLGKSFHGGTDAGPALHHATTMMKEEAYTRADVLMISDFVMGSLSQNLQKDIQHIKKSGNKFYSLAIGNLFLHQKLKSIFDNEWVYNPSTHDISTLVSMTDNI